MGAILYGEFTRLRWRRIDPPALARLENPAATALDADALLSGEDIDEVWGLSPDQCVLLAGHDVVDAPEDNILTLPTALLGQQLSLPSDGIWFIGVQHSAHCWAALRNVSALSRSELTIAWRSLDLPRAGELFLGMPLHGDAAFTLVYPPAQEGERQAMLDPDGESLLIAPFRAERDDDDLEALAVANGSGRGDQARALAADWRRARPKFRYGVLADGLMRWLDLHTGTTPEPVRPATRMFRERLKELSEELARRGIHYQDDEDGYNYELAHAIEDSAVPDDFPEPYAPVARSVSSYYDLDDKVDQARALFDPEDDNEDWLTYTVDYKLMPSRTDVTSTDIIFTGGEIGRSSVDNDQVAALIAECAQAFDLDHSERGRLITVALNGPAATNVGSKG
ncbi:hypothetical protein [Sphingomonas melonis]|uniref:Uncharacterized protein n=1 Tax=Sphingomonas melonis TaxID=152682 RepID=A0A7Y9K319_9SPHN|nr:hypothetical protein [Sphingomonas melonis]NYD91626.1 hypothetical protein [Sphingomonas melonis]